MHVCMYVIGGERGGGERKEQQVESGERARGNSSGFHFRPWKCGDSRNESNSTSSYTLVGVMGPTSPPLWMNTPFSIAFHRFFFSCLVQCKIFFLFYHSLSFFFFFLTI